MPGSPDSSVGGGAPLRSAASSVGGGAPLNSVADAAAGLAGRRGRAALSTGFFSSSLAQVSAVVGRLGWGLSRQSDGGARLNQSATV